MIVRNEAPVIERCLTSALGLFDRWVIVDTGSTDRTCPLIESLVGGVPGELHHRPWRNFADNRNEALELARPTADYILFIDADEEFVRPRTFSWPPLDADGYYLTVSYAQLQYQRCALISSSRDWHWRGVLHECLDSPAGARIDQLAQPSIRVHHDGARSRNPDTYRNDIDVLKLALRSEPQNARYMFYLAQTYRDAGEVALALETYDQRAAMGGWEEESWYAMYQAALLSERSGDDEDVIVHRYLRAWAHRPSRAEPLYELARFHRERSRPAIAFIYAHAAAAVPRPSDILFVATDVYDWRTLDEVGATAYYAGQMDIGRTALQRLLTGDRLPAEHRQRIEANLRFYVT